MVQSISETPFGAQVDKKVLRMCFLKKLVEYRVCRGNK